MLVLLTRPIDSCEASKPNYEAHGFDVVCAPVLEIVSLSQQISLDGYEALAFTSKNAVNSLNILLPNWQNSFDGFVFCVGSATAQALENIDKNKLFVGGSSAKDAAQLICEKLLASDKILYPRAKHVSFDMDGALRGCGLGVTSSVIYEAKQVEKLPDEVIGQLKIGEVVFAPFYSVRSATTFIKLMKSVGVEGLPSTVAVAISSEVASVLAEYSWAEVRVAEEKNESALISQIY